MRILPFIFCLFIQSAVAQVRKVNAEAVVQNVTIFSSGAQVLRSANVAVQAGRSEIVFAGLSNQLEQQSVQLKADANITLLSVQTAKDFFGRRKIEQEEQALIEKRLSLKDKIDADTKLLEVYKNEEQMLIKNQAIGGSAGVKTEELKQALDLHRQRLTELYQKQLEVQNRLAAQQLEWERARAQLTEVSKKKDSVNYSVTALIETKETRSIRFQLTYTIKDAGWYTTYDVRVADVAQPLEVLMNANVFQRSGETWKDINLLLSTGNPGDNATPSPLQPWMLGFYDQSVAWMRSQAIQPGTAAGRIVTETDEPLAGVTVIIKGTKIGTLTDANGFFKLQNFPQGGVAVISSVGFMSKEVALKPGYFTVALKPSAANLNEVVVVGYSSSLEGAVPGVSINNDRRKQKEEEIQTVTVVTQYQPTTTVYAIEDKYTLETDGKTTTIGIKKFSVPSLYEYYAAPKIDPSAFLTAKILNWQDYDLQSGEVSLYLEGTFLGKTYLDLAAASDTLSLSLGKDNGVKVARRLVKEFSAKRFIGNNRSESKQYELTLRNTKKVPVTVIVQDQYPVSVTKEIDVEDIKAPEATVNKEAGIATWNVTLAPGAEKKLLISYTVKYPKDRRVLVD